jgi:ribosome-interacting GTPase 1
MPTNLPPEYYQVEERYKAAGTPQEKVELLEELISTIPKHKGTDHLRADLRRRLSKLKEASSSQKRSGGLVSAFVIEKEGAGQAVVIGPTNTGKSSLLANHTNAHPEVAASPFTTWTPTPGMFRIENIQVQLVDTPPLDRDFLEPELFQLIRTSDLILLMVDLQADPVRQLTQSIDKLIENRIIPLHISQQYPERGLKHLPLLVLVNKCDTPEDEESYHIFCQLLEEQWPCLPVSADTGYNLDRLGQAILRELHVIRVYSWAPTQKEPDLSRPFVLKEEDTVADFARKVHKDFYEKLKSARVWGKGADFDGMMVSRDHPLHDGDIVQLKI